MCAMMLVRCAKSVRKRIFTRVLFLCCSGTRCGAELVSDEGELNATSCDHSRLLMAHKVSYVRLDACAIREICPQALSYTRFVALLH